jgi:tRNA(Ile)-lysidine synthase TilS/MesJ
LQISKKIQKIVGRTNAQYTLIEQGDRVLVGLSGGKDSFTLLHALKRMQQVAPFDFELKAVTVSYGMGENFDYIKSHCKEHNIDFEVYDTNTYEIANDTIRKNSSFCSFFSRMRRGALYSYALNNGYNKLALGHHLDDAMESFFMNFMYNGALRSMPPIYRANNGIFVIRPLIFARERQLEAFAQTNNINTIGDEACPAMRFDIKMPKARAEAKELLRELEEKNSEIFVSMKSAFKNIQLDSFFLTKDDKKDKYRDFCKDIGEF